MIFSDLLFSKVFNDFPLVSKVVLLFSTALFVFAFWVMFYPIGIHWACLCVVRFSFRAFHVGITMTGLSL